MRKLAHITLFLFILLSIIVRAEGQLNRNAAPVCYPQSWWAGMKYNRLLLIIRGNGVATGTASISYSGIIIAKQYPGTDRDNSTLFVEIEISPGALPGNAIINVTRGGSNIATLAFELKRRISSVKLGKLSGSDVIYQIVPDRFANGNTANDNIAGQFERAERRNPSGIHGGDLEGIIQNAGYIEKLGATAVELAPLYESNQLVQSYDKFAPTNHYNIDTRLGTFDDCSRMVSAFHARNIKVILTIVLNKTGNQHLFYQTLPLTDWCFPRPQSGVMEVETDAKPIVFGDPYSSKEDVDRNIRIWETFDTPPLNHSIDEVRRYLVQNVLWWIESTGVDGIRIEQTHLNSQQLLKELGKAISDDFPGLNVISAPATDMVVHNYFWKNGSGNEKYFSHSTDMPLYRELMDAFADYQNPNKALLEVYKIIASDRIYDNAINELVLPIDGHDLTRLFTLAEKDPAIFRMYMGFVLTAGRIPSFLYGSEIQMEGLALAGYGFVRGDLPGGWAGDPSSVFTQQGLTLQQRESYLYVNKLLEWRKANADLMESRTIHFEPRDDIYAYFRCANKKKLLVIINNNPDSPRRMESNRFAMTIGNISKVYNVVTGETSMGLGTLILNPKSIMILELTCDN
ncbi:MAG: cyclomaltodextrinase C-terminal domain-containing protein [Cytophagaceae bacterium]|jgi:glycosidase|nr:cyclomaltodextrinase C-terminal domain-containing protein [Cytophagaceae bacterium]